MGEKNAVAGILGRIAAGDDVDQQSSAGNAVEGCGHPCGERRVEQARPEGDEIAELFGQRHQRRGDHPAILAAAAGGDQHAVIAQPVRRTRDLCEIGVIDVAGADLRAEIAAIAMRRQKPQNIRIRCGLQGHSVSPHAVQAALETSMRLGIRPSLKNASAIFCCPAKISGVSLITPYFWRSNQVSKHGSGQADLRRDIRR